MSLRSASEQGLPLRQVDFPDGRAAVEVVLLRSLYIASATSCSFAAARRVPTTMAILSSL
eukprot:9498848-Pyramimonas_sp.AAC.1